MINLDVTRNNFLMNFFLNYNSEVESLLLWTLLNCKLFIPKFINRPISIL